VIPSCFKSIVLCLLLLAPVLTLTLPAYAEPSIEIRGIGEVQEIWLNLNTNLPSSPWVEFKKIGTIEKLAADTSLYHWTNRVATARLGKQGKVDASELEFLLDQPKGQLVGGGFYSSLDAWNSKQFGDRLLVMKLDHPASILNLTISTSIPKDQWPAISRKLREHGIKAIKYSQNWFNFIDPKTLTQIRTGTLQDITSAPSFRSIQDIVLLDSKGLLQSDKIIREKFPIVAKVLEGNALTPEEAEHLFERIQDEEIITPRFTNLFRERLFAQFKDYYGKPENMQIPHIKANSYTNYLRLGRMKNFSLKELALDKPVPKFQSSLPYKDPQKIKNLGLDAFGEKLSRSFEFIGYDDLMLAMAQGHPEPWRLYDEPGKKPLLDRWTEALSQKNHRSLEGVIAINRVLSDNPNSAFRDKPVIAGGDIPLNGKGYFRINEFEKKSIESNDLLISEIVPDPSAPADRKTYLGRYEYPSAKNYTKFEKYISPGFYQELKLAEQNGKLEEAGMTRRMLENMATQISGTPADEVVTYHRMLSLHPFEDYNGRTMRAIYQLESERPMFLRNWDRDVFRDSSALSIEMVNGEGQIANIREGLVTEYLKDPANPKYYDVPEIWQVAAETDFNPKDPAKFVAESKAWYLKPENRELVRQKRGAELQYGLRNNCIYSKLQQFIRFVP